MLNLNSLGYLLITAQLGQQHIECKLIYHVSWVSLQPTLSFLQLELDHH